MKENLKVLIITYYWPPSGGSGVQRWTYFAKYISDFGIIPTVITVDERYASYPSKDISLNSLIEDIQVYRTKTLEPLRFYSILKSGKSDKIVPQGNVGGKKKGVFDKLATYIRANFFIPDARVGWNRYAYSKAKELIQQQNFDLIITTGPPHSTHLVGQQLKKDFNIKWMADFRDPWTEVYYNKLFKRTPKKETLDKMMELGVLSDADLVLTVGPSMSELLSAKIPLQKSKFHFIYNGFDSSKFEKLQKNQNELFTIRYVGTLTENYPYKAFIDAVNLLELGNLTIQVELIGNIEASVFSYFQKNSSFTVVNTPSVSHSLAIQYMKDADVLLLLLPFMENSQIMLTGKLFEYLATENPILCIGDQKADAVRIIEQLGNSASFQMDEIKSICDFLFSTYKKTKQNSETLLNSNKFSRYETARELSKLIKGLM